MKTNVAGPILSTHILQQRKIQSELSIAWTEGMLCGLPWDISLYSLSDPATV